MRTTEEEIQVTKKLARSRFIKSIPLVMIVAFAIIITFANEFVNHYPDEYYIHKQKYKEIIKKRNKELDELMIGTNLETDYRVIISNSKKELKEYTTKKNKYLNDSSILGYNSPKAMLLSIGYPISALILSLLFYNFIIKSNESNLKKKLYLKIINSFILTFSYWTVWSLMWFKIDGEYDIPDYILYPIFCIIAVTIFLISRYLISYNKTIEEKLKNGIKLLINYISIDLYDKRNNKKEALISDLKKYDELTKIIK